MFLPPYALILNDPPGIVKEDKQPAGKNALPGGG
jgi:hypothetical protein